MPSPSWRTHQTQKWPALQGAEIWKVLDPRGQPHLVPKGVGTEEFRGVHTYPKEKAERYLEREIRWPERRKWAVGSCWLREGSLEWSLQIKATGSGLVFSVTEESDESHTFLSGRSRQFIHLFIPICMLPCDHSTNIDGARFCVAGTALCPGIHTVVSKRGFGPNSPEFTGIW